MVPKNKMDEMTRTKRINPILSLVVVEVVLGFVKRKINKNVYAIINSAKTINMGIVKTIWTLEHVRNAQCVFCCCL
jgi:hypothetical protein